MWSQVLLELKQHVRRMNNSLLLCAINHWFVTFDHAHCSGLILQWTFADDLKIAHDAAHCHRRQSFWWFEFILCMYDTQMSCGICYTVYVPYVHTHIISTYYIYIYNYTYIFMHLCVCAPSLMFLCTIWWSALPLDVSGNSYEVVDHLPNNVPL